MSKQSNVSDEVLISQIREGDRHAFDAAYHRYVKVLFHYAAVRIHSREEAEEMVQDIFVSLWTRRESLNIGSLRHYLYSSVKYKIIRFISHSHVQQKYAEHFRLFESLEESPDRDDPYPRDINRFLEEGMARLPERCQQALKLRLVENLSNSDIALRMNISKGTVENYMVTAITQLRAFGKQVSKQEE